MDGICIRTKLNNPKEAYVSYEEGGLTPIKYNVGDIVLGVLEGNTDDLYKKVSGISKIMEKSPDCRLPFAKIERYKGIAEEYPIAVLILSKVYEAQKQERAEALKKRQCCYDEEMSLEEFEAWLGNK